MMLYEKSWISQKFFFFLRGFLGGTFLHFGFTLGEGAIAVELISPAERNLPVWRSPFFLLYYLPCFVLVRCEPGLVVAPFSRYPIITLPLPLPRKSWIPPYRSPLSPHIHTYRAANFHCHCLFGQKQKLRMHFHSIKLINLYMVG